VHAATAAIGPLGYLLRSPAAARVLVLFTAKPYGRFTLGEIRTQAQAAKGTVHSCLRTLERAALVRREGRGAATAYRYAVEQELAQQMLGVVAASRHLAAAPAAQTFAESMRQWASAAGAAAGTERVGGPQAESSKPEAERLARLKRLPKTAVGGSSPRPAGAYTL